MPKCKLKLKSFYGCAGLFGALTIWSLLGTPAASGDEKTNTLYSSRKIIDAGESAMVQWKTDVKSARLFPSGVRIPNAGQLKVQPANTTTFLLIGSDKNRTVIRSTQITVRGAKGDDTHLDPERYGDPITFVTKSSIEEFANKIRDIVQDEMQFSLYWSQINETKALCTTDFPDRPELVDATEKRVRSRRIAYRIELRALANATTEVVVSAAMDVRLILDETWAKEPADGLLRREIAKLRIKLLH